MSRAFRIVVLPGDGIGPEVTTEALRVLRTLEAFLPGTSWDLEERPAGADCYRESGIAIPEATWTACREADAIFLGAIGLPDVRLEDGTEVAPQLDLRRDLDLYAGVRPVHLFREEHSPLAGYRAGDIDLVIVRESTEGLFVSRDRGVRVGDEVAVDQLLITRRATERVSRFACELARTRDGKKRVTCVDKSNAFRSYAFFREVFDEVAAEYPHLDTERVYVDAMALYLVQRPGEFDVVVTENLLGDILSDLAASLVGGMGMAPSGDIGERHAVFQPAHGSAPDIAGKGRANPVAAVLSVAMMLDHLGSRHEEPSLEQAAARVREAVRSLFREQPRTTPDLGGSMSCDEVGAAICERIRDEG